MRVERHRWLVFCLGILLLQQAASAQSEESREPQDGPRIGLALSGGGVRGFAHLGVLTVLEEMGMPIDAIGGSSIGAAVGGLYAAGYSAGALDSMARHIDWPSLFRSSVTQPYQGLKRELYGQGVMLALPLRSGGVGAPQGLVVGQSLGALLYRLTLPVHDVEDFTDLPIPFLAMAADLETGEAVRLDSGLLPVAIRASSALPSVFFPVQVDTNFYVDGGVRQPLPVSEVRELGADVVICVDVTEPLRPADSLDTFADVMSQVVGFYTREALEAELGGCTILIRPDVEGVPVLAFERATDMIEKGVEAAHAARDELRGLGVITEAGTLPHRYLPPFRDRYVLSKVELEGVDDAMARYIRSVLDLDLPVALTGLQIDATVKRVHDEGLFRSVDYRLRFDEQEDAYTLVILPEAGAQQWLGVGLRYETHYDASILANSVFRNKMGTASTLALRLRLGENLQLGASYDVPFRLSARTSIRSDVAASISSIDLFSGETLLMRSRVRRLDADALLTRPFWRRLVLSIGVQGEVFATRTVTGFSVPIEDGLLAGPTARLRARRMEGGAFSESGYDLRMTADALVPLEGESFAQSLFEAFVVLPVLPGGTSVLAGAAAGVTAGGDPPLHYRYYMGGAFASLPFSPRQVPFWGYDVQQLSALSFLAGWLGIQQRLPHDTFLQLHYNAARVGSQDFTHDGFALSLGRDSVVGPIRLGLSTSDIAGPYDVDVSVGYSF